MPRVEGPPLARFAQTLARDEGLTLGSPWLSDAGSVAVLPILRTASQNRRWRLAIEAADAVSAVDPGRLDRLTVRNEAAFPILLPPGTLFRGADTPSRGTTRGTVLAPRSSASIEVRCVHASCPVRPGAALELDPRLAPEPICRALLARDQGRVWAAVGPSDDLLAALPESDSAEEPDGLVSRVPNEPGQCGLAIVDARGVAAVEWYETPEAWRAVAQYVLRRYAGRLGASRKGPWTASLDASAAVQAVKGFLSGLADRPTSDRPSRSAPGEPCVACTIHDGQLVHLVALARRESEDRTVDWLPSPAVIAEPVGALGAVSPPSALRDIGDADVAAVASVGEDAMDDPAPPRSEAPPRRRKVLTSGWDDATFGRMDRYARKEFRGDRSAAMRFLVREGLRSRGYFGPLEPTRPSGGDVVLTESPMPSTELTRHALDSRLVDLERIAETPTYAVWLRKRARLELERLAATSQDDLLRAAAQASLERLSPVEPEPEPLASLDLPATLPPPAPSVDVRPLLREAFTSSAGGDYRQAIALFDRVLDIEPGHRTARLGRAVAFRRAGKSQEALEDLEAVLGLEPRNAAALLARGQILQARGDLDGALASFELLVDVAASDWDVWMARGDVLAKMGRHEDALRSYGEALRRNPDDQGLRGRIRTVDMARVSAPPTTLPRPSVPPGVEPGQSYLVKEPRRDRSQSLFRALAAQKMPSLILTGRSRDVVRREVGVSGARIIGLSFSTGEDLHDPTALPSLIRMVERFVYDHQGQGVILLEGLHDLVLNNGFREAALCLERIHEVILQSRAILLVSVAPGDLEERESALLERSLRLLS